jgi:transcription elongation factor Elf1
MTSVTASRVGVITAREANRFTCTRCGAVKVINVSRRKTTDRRDYLCNDCVSVLTYTRKD